MFLGHMAYLPSQPGQHEAEWQRETWRSSEFLKLKAPNSTRKHRRMWSDSLARWPERSGNTKPTKGKTASLVIHSQANLDDNDGPSNGNADTLQSQSNAARQTYKQTAKHSIDSDNQPHLLSHIKPSISSRQHSSNSKRTSLVPAQSLCLFPFPMESLQRSIATPIPGILKDTQVPLQLVEPALHITGDQNISEVDIELQHIQKLRINTWAMRSKTQEMRTQLRERQNAKSTADDKLFQYIRKLELGVPSQKSNLGMDVKGILELMQNCEEARDQYGPLEDDYYQLEDQLSEQEFELTRMEERFYKRRQSPGALTQVQPETSAFPNSDASSTTSDDEDESQQTHPLVASFLSKMGDLDLLRERLDDLVEVLESLEEKNDSRRHFGLFLAKGDQDWLDNSQTTKNELLEKIRIIEHERDNLRQECFLRGLVDEAGEPTDFRSRERGTFVGEEDVDPQGQISEYVKYPLLLPQPGSKHRNFKEYRSQPSTESENIASRINHWLLERLRSSALDVSLLARTFEGRVGEIHERWQVEVLSFWYEDDTITGGSGFQVYTSSRTTQTHLHSNHSATSSDYCSDNHSYRIFVRSSSLRLRQRFDRSNATELAVIVGTSSASPRGKFYSSSE